MAQQLNLLDPPLALQTLWFSARQGLWLLASLALAMLIGVQGLHWARLDAETQSRDLAARMLPLQARRQALTVLTASGPGSAAAELARLRSIDADQRRITAALTSGLVSARQGPADYLVALARQASSALWITGFAVSEDGSAVELDGRMTDPAALADYLRSLNGEPQFKGRPFAQLSLTSRVGNDAGAATTEFSLRSNAMPGSAGRRASAEPP
jgi:Tfp pilus assembly protein PilN